MLYFFSAIKDAYADSIELRNRNQKYGQINNFVSTIILLYFLYSLSVISFFRNHNKQNFKA